MSVESQLSVISDQNVWKCINLLNVINFLFTHITSHHYLTFGRIVLTRRSANTTSDHPDTQRLHPIVGVNIRCKVMGASLRNSMELNFNEAEKNHV